MDAISIETSKQDTENFTLQDFESNIKYRDGKFEVKLPWKEDHATVPTNRDLAAKRLNSNLSDFVRIPKNYAIMMTSFSSRRS